MDKEISELLTLDEEIYRLVELRLEKAAGIGKASMHHSGDLKEFAREKSTVQHAVGLAEKIDLPKSLLRQMAELLVDYSIRKTERAGVEEQASGTGKTALVIGGKGKIGGWFAAFLRSQSFRVSIADPQIAHDSAVQKSDWRRFGLDFDVIVVSAPLGISNEILLELATLMPAGLVFDVASLKTPVKPGLQALVDAGCQVTSVHPMFGPATQMLSKKHVVFIDVGHTPAMKAARALFEKTLAICVEMSLDAHDRAIAYVLGLSHLINIAFFTALKNSGTQASQLQNISSTSFDAQLQVAEAISKENPALYYEIQRLNDFRAAPRDGFLNAMKEIIDVIEADDPAAFEALMTDGKSYLQHLIDKD